MIKGGRILVVDDDTINIEIMSEILEDEFSVSIARSGNEALARIDEFEPDLVLLDIMMPGLDGYETCQQLRQTKQMKHGKIILVSAKAMLSERMKGYEAGADDYLTKPFDAAELVAKVRVFLRLKRVEEVHDLRANMLATLRSETRTPMTGILSAAELLAQESDVGKEDRAQWHGMILDNAKRLDTLLEKGNLLCDYKEGTVKLKLEPVELANVLEKVVARRRPDIEKKGLSLELMNTEAAWVQGHADHLRLVCNVLLDNAIKYSPENGRIEIGIQRHQTDIVLRVTDHGPGMSSERQACVFDGLLESDIDHGDRCGLSLALSRAVVLYHGGRIDVDSKPDVRTTFSVSLPHSIDGIVNEQAESKEDTDAMGPRLKV